MATKKSIILKIIGSLFIIGVIGAAIAGYFVYTKINVPNVDLKGKEFVLLYISSDASYEDVIDSIDKLNILINKESFEWVAEKKKYPQKVKPGRYKIKDKMSNTSLVNMLRSGDQYPVKLKFNNIRTKEQLAGKIGKQLETDSIEIIKLLNDKDFVGNYGFNTVNILAMFIPNTYEIFWNTTATQFMERMHKEYKSFWTEERRAKAKEIDLTPLQVSVLASIVQAEQAERKDEQPMVAGVYINRIKKDMYLESCPTLIYAIGDFTITRVLDKHKEVVSPYNTYKNPGLPPSPINLPEISALDAVLNYEKHDYIFMCAKEDFSGYHNFSKTNAQHEAYARRFQAELNRRGIKR